MGVRPVPAPGLLSRPIARPIATAISEVTMNHSRVREASRAALLTCRRLVIDTRIAKKTSGATASFSSWTKRSPMCCSVVVSQPTSPLLAIQPSSTPRARPARICAQNGILGMREDWGLCGACEDSAVSADVDNGHTPGTDERRQGTAKRSAGNSSGCGAAALRVSPARRGGEKDLRPLEERGQRRQQAADIQRQRSTCRRATSGVLMGDGGAAAVFMTSTLTLEL